MNGCGEFEARTPFMTQSVIQKIRANFDITICSIQVFKLNAAKIIKNTKGWISSVFLYVFNTAYGSMPPADAIIHLHRLNFIMFWALLQEHFQFIGLALRHISCYRMICWS
jgi:hypothetical protein